MKHHKKTWRELKDNECPNCKVELEKGMFDSDYSSCQNCGFVIKDTTKNLLVNRDHNDTEHGK